MNKIIVFMSLLICFAFQSARATDYYVSKTGNDSNSGTETDPWLTIQKAANSAMPGSTVNIKGGTYNEKVNIGVSGTVADGYITFQNFGSDVVILDGTGLPVSGSTALLKIDSKSYIKIKGLQICNLRTSAINNVPMGILVTGTAGNIELRNNYIHHIANTASISRGGNGRDAHGLAVYGTSGTTAISNLIIDGNEIANCTLGSSESMVVNGNVDGFQITNNVVHDNDNIGIDCIGYEGTAPSNDQARNGIVRGNTVYNITSSNNLSYAIDDLCADGIYVDGGKDIVIERNVVHHVDIGIEVASEHSGKTTTGVTVRDNLIYKCNYTGLAFGGYDTSTGWTANCSFLNNTLIQNDTTGTWTGDILIQQSHDNVVKNNIIYTSSQSVPMTNPFGNANSYNNTFDYNLYFTPASASGSTYIWKNVEYTSFSAYKIASGQDANSVFGNPLFANVATFDVHLQAGSPAIDAGDPARIILADEKDLYGNARMSGTKIDIGASESNGVSPVTYNVTFDLVGKGTRTGGGALVQTVAQGAAATAPTVSGITGWIFTGWDKTFNNITADTTVTAQYSATYTVTFDLAGKGTRSGGGALVQTVAQGAAATAPTVSAITGWIFTGWDKTFNNITADTTVTAQYSPAPSYTVTFVEGANGTVTGTKVQTVVQGNPTTEVTAAPSTGYHFVNWTGDLSGTTNPLTVSNVMADMTITANFDINTYNVVFELGGYGTRTGGGALIQSVTHGSGATAPTVSTNPGCSFTGWNRGFSNVTADTRVIAQYYFSICTVTFVEGANGTITGTKVQNVNNGDSTTEVTAVPLTGYHFVNWSGGLSSTANPLTISNVTIPMTVTANFAMNDVQIVTEISALNVNEGSTATFQVKLMSQPVINKTVSVSKTSGDNSITVKSGSSLTFTPENWNTYQIVTVAAAQDADLTNGTATITCSSSGSNNQTVTVTEIDDDTTLTVTSGGNGTTSPSGVKTVIKSAETAITATPNTGYHFVNWAVTNGAAAFANASSASTTVAITDPATIRANFVINDVQISTDNISINVNEGFTSTFKVKLTAQPTASKTVTVSRTAGDTSITVKSGASLTFTTATWNTYQTVTIAAAQDADAVNGAATITCSSTGMTNQTVTANEVEDDINLTVTSSNGTTTPPGTVIVAKSAVTAISSSANTGYHFVGWTVESGSAVFGNASLAATTVSSTENTTINANFELNVVNILTDVSALNVPEGATAVFKVKLSAQPAEVKTVLVSRTSGDTDISVSSGSTLTFSTSNWNTYQDVTLTATEDADAANGTAQITCSSSGIADKIVTATEIDNDYILSVLNDGKGTTDPSGAVVVQKGLSKNISAAPNTGYHFMNWTITSGTGIFGNASSQSTLFTSSADTAINANFEINTYTVTFDLDGQGVRTGGGALSQTVNHGAAATAPTVSGSYGMVFIGWDRTFNNVTANITVTATYAVPIADGVPNTGISGAAGSSKQYPILVPAGQFLLEVKTYGGTGDCDITVSGKVNGVQTVLYSSGPTNNETLHVDNPEEGYYIISLIAKSDYAGLTLLAKYYSAKPLPPTAVTATKGTYPDAILLSWKASVGTASYLIYRAETKAIPSVEIADTSDISFFDNDENLQAGKTYYYWVKSKNGSALGISDPSTVSAGNISNNPAAPATVAASDGTYFDKIRITWSKTSGASSYLVFRTDALSPKPSPATDTPLYETTATYYDDFGSDIVLPRKIDGTVRKYYYWIAAKNKDAASALKSNDGYLSKKGPANIAASTTYSDRITVTWAAVPDATGYDVYRFDDNAFKIGGTQINGEPVKALEYEDKSPAPGIYCYYKVKAKYGSYYDSDFSTRGAKGKLGSLDTSAAELKNDVPSSPNSGAKGSNLYFSFEVPMGTNRLVATLNGTTAPTKTNDCDLFAKFANLPTKYSYNAKGVENATNEILTVRNPSPGIWYFLLYGTTDYNGITLTVNCYSVCNIKLTQVPQNDMAVPFTATFKGMVVDETGNTGVPNIVLQVRNPMTGLTSLLPKTDAKGFFTYSTNISTEGEHTFSFLFIDIPDIAEGTTSHTVWTRKGCSESNSFDFSSYLAATSVTLGKEDLLGMQSFLNIRNGWEFGSIDGVYQTMWLEKTISSTQTDTNISCKLDAGLYMFFYGVEGAIAGSNMTTASAFSAVPFVVHVEASNNEAVLSNLNTLGIIDDTQKSAILAGSIGVITVASLSSATEGDDGDMNISLLGREQLEILANLAAGIADSEDFKYSDVTAKKATVTIGTGRKINVVVSAFLK